MLFENILLRNRNSAKCLAVQNASRSNTAPTLQYTCDNTAPFNERWEIVGVRPGDPYVHIVNRHSGKCLTIRGATVVNSAPVVQYECDSAAPYNEEWMLVSISQSTNHYHIVNRLSSKCLTIQNNSLANNARALQYTCNYDPNLDNEEWEIWSRV